MREALQLLLRFLVAITAAGLLPAAVMAQQVEIVNTASATFGISLPNAATVAQQSNTVLTTVTIAPPQIEFFRDASFTSRSRAARSGSPLYLEAFAEGCAHDLNHIESVHVTVTTVDSQDMETYTAVETAVDSAIFRVNQHILTRRVASGQVTQQNHLLELWGEDQVQAWILNCAGSDNDNLLIDPAGMVFDSQTNQPIAGATVRLVDITGAGNGSVPNGDARVFDFDGMTPAPSTVVSDADGLFQFPLVPPSSYRVAVTPPGDYRFPSTHTVAELPVDRVIHATGSFGGAFEVSAATGMVTLDVPLDADPTGLVVEKRASRSTAEIGETVGFSIDIRNISGLALSGISLHDDLPLGFTYVAGSAKLDGERVADPVGGKGPALDFTIGSLGAEQRTLTYRVAIGPGALQGDGTNRARLNSAIPARKRSNVGSATIKVSGGVFDDRAYVLGKVFADCDSNGLQEANEPGVPRVRMYMEDGSFVITDGEGKYSFYGVTPRTHVLKVDVTTLPSGVTLAANSHRNAGDGNSRFLDVQRSEMHRADFATDGCAPALVREIAQRAEKQAGLGRELDQSAKTELKTEETLLGDVRALPASGIVGDLPGMRTEVLERLRTQASPPPKSTLQSLLPHLDSKLGFIGLQDDEEIHGTQTTLRVKGLAHTQIQLQINDEYIDDARVGMRVTDDTRHVQALEFVGIDLQPGENQMLLVQRDQFGNIREMTQLRVTAAGQAAQIHLVAPIDGVPADGDHWASIHVEVLDLQGVPVAARTAVTLEATLGEWQIADFDPIEPGTQVFIEGGAADFLLRAPTATGQADIRATGASNEATAKVNFVAALRPLLAAGLVEGTLQLNKLDPKALLSTRREDGFERELRSFTTGDDETSAGARAALFLKGKVRGSYLLTLGYDSDKDRNQRLFRDIQPDQFYPVYGDSSVKGYDAQSTGRLYVRVERNKSYLLGGDITTQNVSQTRVLGAYSRSLTGVKEHFETDAVIVDAFASNDSTTQVIEEQPANGTSGPFFLGNANALENSELVEILTRDRNQPSIVIRAVPLQRFTDYEVETLTGRILLRAPVPSVDGDLNPISIRFTYEVDQGGERFWVSGLDTQVRMNEYVTVGAAVADDRNPLDARRIASANTQLKLGEGTTLIGEVAHTERDLQDNGMGQRIEVRHEGSSLQLRSFVAHTDENFDNPSSGYSASRSEAGAKAGYSLTETTRLVGEALHSEDVTTHSDRNGAFFGVEQSLAHNIKAELGARHVIDSPADASQTTTTSLRTKISTPLPKAPRATVFGEYEQDIDETESRVIAAGGNYQVGSRAKLYARHEFISSLSGPYALDPTQKHNTTVFGVDSSYWKDDHMFSEYRVADALTGREAQAAIGLRNGWQVARGVRLNTSFEKVDAVRGSANGESTALTGAVEYTRNPLWKGTARLELRDSASGDGVLSTLGVAYKMSEDWTFLGKNVFAFQENGGTRPDRTQDRFQMGMAYRDNSTNRVNALMRYEFKREEGVELGLTRNVHIASLHADLQSSAKTLWRAQYATKFVTENVDGMKIDNAAHLIGGRVTHDMGKRWDAGLHARALFNRNFDGYQGGVGTEVGFLLHENLWISTGYNVLGFRDDDLAANEYTERGGYVRLRFKFDESLLN